MPGGLGVGIKRFTLHNDIHSTTFSWVYRVICATVPFEDEQQPEAYARVPTVATVFGPRINRRPSSRTNCPLCCLSRIDILAPNYTIYP